MTQIIISHDPYSDAVISNEVPVVDIEVKHAKLLVLDLDETLVHSGFSKPDNYDHEVIIRHKNTEYIIYVQKRPGFDFFMENVIQQFDVCIFTASLAEYSIPVIKRILPSFPESNILTREHCIQIQRILVKDLSIFKRDFSNIIIVDNSPLSFQMNIENGIVVPAFVGDPTDDYLLNELLPYVQELDKCEDVREKIGELFQ